MYKLKHQSMYFYGQTSSGFECLTKITVLNLKMISVATPLFETENLK